MGRKIPHDEKADEPFEKSRIVSDEKAKADERKNGDDWSFLGELDATRPISPQLLLLAARGDLTLRDIDLDHEKTPPGREDDDRE